MNRTETVSAAKVNSAVGIKLPADEIANLLTRMCLNASVKQDAAEVFVHFLSVYTYMN